jgi:transcriptional regulator
VPRQVDLKFKLSQNHPVANRESVAAQLQGQAREHSRSIAALMRERDTQTGD